MWENMLILHGTIEQKDGKLIDEEVFFEILEDNGYQFQGGYDDINHSKINEAIHTISESINDRVLNGIYTTLTAHYGEMNDESIIEFLECNTGTAIFQKVFQDNLHDNQLTELFSKYSDTNWKISDEFEGLLGREVAEKFMLWRKKTQ